MAGKTNQVSFSMKDYMQIVIGDKGVGKTTLMAKLSEFVYGNLDRMLLVSVGKEDGHITIDGCKYENPQTFSEFQAVMDDIIDNANSPDNDYDMVVIDTIDELFKISEKEILAQHFREKGKIAKSLNDALGGYGNGKKALQTLLGDTFYRLQKSKYGVFWIGHNKIRKRKTDVDAEEYQLVSTNLEKDYFNVFAYPCKIVCNIVTGMETDESGAKSTQRYMYFRTDGNVEASSNFANMPVRVPHGAEEYYNAVMGGIRLSLDREISDDEFEKLKKRDMSNKAKRAKDFLKKEKTQSKEKEIKDILLVEVRDSYKDNFTKDEKLKVKEFLTKWKIGNLKIAEDFTVKQLETLKAIHKD